MEEDEITPNIPPQSKIDRVLELAQKELERRKKATVDDFRNVILVTGKAFQVVQMIEHLNEIIAQKESKGADVRNLRAQYEEVCRTLEEAVNTNDDAVILHIHTTIERMLDNLDPLYMEVEEGRKREYIAKRKRGNTKKARWFSNPSSRFVSLLKGDYRGVEDVTEEERRSCISSCAWGFAIIGMLVAIIFVIIDYWSAQANPALTTNLIRNNEIELPPVYGCLSTPLIPTFANLPNATHNGTALWGLRSYTNLETGETFSYKESLARVIEPSILGRPEYCQGVMQYISKDNILNGLDPKFDPAKKCFSCVRIGGRKSVRLSYERAEKRTRGAVTLEFARTRDFDYCFNPYAAADENLRNAVRLTLRENGQKLVDRGIIVLISAPNINFAFDYGFEDFKFAYPRNPLPQLEAMATVFCNLYFLSGYFFPVEPNKEIRYSYDMNAGLQGWKPLGNISNFLTVKPILQNRNLLEADRFSILNEIRGGSTQTRQEYTVNMFIHSVGRNNTPSFNDYAATLRENHNDMLLFSKTIDGGVEKFSTAVQLGSEKQFKALGRHTRFNVSLDLKTFEVEVITRRPTTSTSEFLADVVEYIGLFTGVCAYSVLVGPARLYLKKTRTK